MHNKFSVALQMSWFDRWPLTVRSVVCYYWEWEMRLEWQSLPTRHCMRVPLHLAWEKLCKLNRARLIWKERWEKNLPGLSSSITLACQLRQGPASAFTIFWQIFSDFREITRQIYTVVLILIDPQLFPWILIKVDYNSLQDFFTWTRI